MKRESLKSNFVFQFLYQVVLLLLPFLLTPILTRRLGSYYLGVYSYANGIAYYFIILANLGISRHGQRIISYRRDDDESLRKAFWSLFLVHFVSAIFAFLAYLLMIVVFVKQDKPVFVINLLYVASAIFDVTWLFYGLESFKNVVVKNLAIKIIASSLVFFFVHSPDDLYKYTTIEVSSVLLGNIYLFVYAFKCIKPIKISLSDCREHIKPLLVLSITVIASTLYTVFDKTLLGILSSKNDVAFYEYSNRIISIPKTFIGVIGTVLFPKACSMAAKSDEKGLKAYAKYSYFIVSFISCGSIFGLLALGNQLANVYFGDGFSVCGQYMMFLSPLILIIGLGDVVRSLFLIPMKKDLAFVICLCLNALVNLVLSLSLIPVIGLPGAIIGTTAAELFGLSFQLIYCRKQIDFLAIGKALVLNSLSGIIMVLIIKLLGYFYPLNTIKGLFVGVSVGVFVFSVLSIFIIKFFYTEIWHFLIDYLKKKLNKPFPGSAMVCSNERRERDFSIDVLRALGIFLIILAHTTLKDQDNSLLMNFRRFDVVMLVFVSGLSYVKSSSSLVTWNDYWNYVKKRVKRLLVPCWFFISFYFLFSIVIKPFIPNTVFSLPIIIYSYTLISGFGYVWIIRVLFCLALLAPFLRIIESKVENKFLNICIIIVSIGIVSCLGFFARNLDGIISTIVNVLVLQVLGYSIVYYSAICFTRFNRIQKITLIIVLLGLTILFFFIAGIDMSSYKYPPTLSYLSYGLLISISLYLFLTWLNKRLKTNLILQSIVFWISNNSLNIYFAHVFFLFLFDYGNANCNNWIIQYVILLSGSILSVFIYDYLRNKTGKNKGKK